MFSSGLCSKKIGEIFLEKGLITEKQLIEALEYQEKFGGRLGWILISLGYVKRRDFFSVLSEHYGIPFVKNVEALKNNIDINFLKNFDPEFLAAHEVVPMKIDRDVLYLLTSNPFSKKFNDALSKISALYNFTEVKTILITDLDLIKILESFFKNKFVDKAVYGLFYISPEDSAIKVLTKGQILALYFLGIILIFGLFMKPLETLLILNFLIQSSYLLVNLFKFVVGLAGSFTEIEFKIEDNLIHNLDDKNLPVYSILAPLYRESEVIPTLIKSLKNLNYPKNKLDVLFLVEEDDKETLKAIKEQSPPASWRIIIIPDAKPRTKPKACNYGIFFSRGEYVVIYDAEDVPEKDQLKKALVAFRFFPDDYICFQAALNYYNRNENFLTKMFTLEYSYWFDYMLPGLHKLEMIIPLGGTSNHFVKNKLEELGAWDPFNVTEDADLGVRAFSRKYKVGVINSTTWEEANSKIMNWIRQRSRWIKGYIQTWLVHMRNPVKLYRNLGFKGFLSFHLLIGGTPFIFLVNPIMWAMFVYWLITKTYILEPFFPPIILYSALFNLFLGNFIAIYLSMLAVFKRKYYDLLPYALFNPFYWFLHTMASYKAIYELITRPFYWQKTQHGLSKIKLPILEKPYEDLILSDIK